MIKVGIIGLGFMGQTHLRCYQKLAAMAEVVAISDIDPKRAAGDFSGSFSNLGDSGLAPLDMTRIQGTTDYRQLLAMREIDLIDICVPTTIHAGIAQAAARTGKHVLCEKPLARTSAEAAALLACVDKSAAYFMPAMCIRFWPEWRWLKEAIADGRYGKVRSVRLTRLATPPPGWYRDGKLSGGAALDLHIHDSDFIRYCFGEPEAVCSQGYFGPSGLIDHLVTQYRFKEVPLVVAEGGWAMAEGFGFRMSYTVNFERATADYDIGRDVPLVVHEKGVTIPIDCGRTDGWFEEIRYLLNCIDTTTRPAVVTVADAMKSIELVEREIESVAIGGEVSL